MQNFSLATQTVIAAQNAAAKATCYNATQAQISSIQIHASLQTKQFKSAFNKAVCNILNMRAKRAARAALKS